MKNVFACEDTRFTDSEDRHAVFIFAKGSPSLTTTICSHKASQLVSKLGAMAQKHFNLKSTTVTGIPMKV